MNLFSMSLFILCNLIKVLELEAKQSVYLQALQYLC